MILINVKILMWNKQYFWENHTREHTFLVFFKDDFLCKNVSMDGNHGIIPDENWNTQWLLYRNITHKNRKLEKLDNGSVRVNPKLGRHCSWDRPLRRFPRSSLGPVTGKRNNSRGGQWRPLQKHNVHVCWQGVKHTGVTLPLSLSLYLPFYPPPSNKLVSFTLPSTLSSPSLSLNDWVCCSCQCSTKGLYGRDS